MILIEWEWAETEVYELESADTPFGGSWLPSRAVPLAENGKWQVRMDRPASDQFFRLLKR